ncbi:MAG: glycosyltransferase [Candidatus Andersenbacteria bacterium]
MIVRGKTIVLIATVAWQRNWQRQQEWAKRLAEHNRVLYVAPYGMTSMGPLTVLKKFARERGFTYQHHLSTQAQKNLEHVRLKFIPIRNKVWLNWVNVRWMQHQLKKLGVLDGPETLFWVCNPADTSVALVTRYPKSRVLYDIAMRFSLLPDAPPWIMESQARLAERANVIIYDATASLEDLPSNSHYKATYIPQGCAEERLTQTVKEHPAVAQIPHPRAVYIGLDTVLDVPLLKKLLAEVPALQLVMIGDVSPHPIEDPRVHWIGPVNYHQKDRYLAGADVALIPYLVNRYTAGTFPTKFFEYRALGLPVVSTALPELRQFTGQVQLAKTPLQFVEQVRTLLNKSAKSNGIVQTVPHDFLAEHTWSKRFEKVQEVLGPL